MEPAVVPINRWMDTEIGSLYTMELYSDIEERESTNLEENLHLGCIILSEVT